MFKRLKERIAEEATKFPVGQHGFGNNAAKPSDSIAKAAGSSEDLITLSDSSSVIITHPSSKQFSIAEDEDGSMSDANSPQKRLGNSYSSELFLTPNTPGGTSDPNTSNTDLQPYVPQTDIESEVEEPPTLNLDGISKEQLASTIVVLKARLCKYKNKYAEVVKAFKSINEEKNKLEHALTENQDKSLRRIAELREQCQLEQKAKAHLEENLRLILEEKDSRISVLETQINLLKETRDSSVEKESHDAKEYATSSSMTEEDVSLILIDESPLTSEKEKKLQELLKECKTSIIKKNEQISHLTEDRESLSKKVEDLTKLVEELKTKEVKSSSEHEATIQVLKKRLVELEQQQEDSVMSMAETKRNMHEELELKERQLVKAKEEARQLQLVVDHESSVKYELQKQYEDKVRDLQNQLENMARTMEEDKQSLMHDLSRGKTEAVALMQQDCARKLTAIEEEWKAKYESLEKECEKSAGSKEDELILKLQDKAQELISKKKEFEDNSHRVKELQDENTELSSVIEQTRAEKDSIQKLFQEKEDTLQSCMSELSEKSALLKRLQEEYDLLQKSDTSKSSENMNDCRIQVMNKLETVEANYSKQVKSLQDEIVQLRKQKCELQKENKESLENMQDEYKIKLDEQAVEFLSKMEEKDFELTNAKNALENAERNFKQKLSETENRVKQLEHELSALNSSYHTKVEDLNKKIKQLQCEREQLMIQAQERVAATDTKYREDIGQFQKQVQQLQTANIEMEKIKGENKSLHQRLEESRIQISNEADVSKELITVKKELVITSEELDSTKVTLTCKVKELEKTLCELDTKNQSIERLQQEKSELYEKVSIAEQAISDNKKLQYEITSLKSEINKLRAELDSATSLKFEKDELNSKIKLLEQTKNDLTANVKLLEAANENLRTSTNNKNCDNCNCDKILSLQSENQSLRNQIEHLQSVSISERASDTELLKMEYSEKLQAKEEEMEMKVRDIITEFCSQMNIENYNCDQNLSDVVERLQCQEEKIQREHRVEVSSLRQDILEKDRALDEMHEHYEILLNEKDEKLKKMEHTQSRVQSEHTAESSDWDDTWVVPDESCEASSNVQDTRHAVDCEVHLKQIETLKEEVEKCNSELKDLRILLRLSPPESLHSNNNYCPSPSNLPEPTELEYLKNILFEYMMGKETETLAKVIAAVLKFSKEQTRLVIEREKTKQSMR